MVTITTELGTFEASTEKEAKAMLRKAMAAIRKADQDRSVNADRARQIGEANGYKILCRIASGESFPGGWRFDSPIGKYVPWELTYRHSLSCGNVPEIKWHGEHGDAESSHYGNDFWGAVTNGAGFPLAAFLRDQTTQQIEAYAIGIFADQIAFVPLPGVTIEMFKTREQEQSA